MRYIPGFTDVVLALGLVVGLQGCERCGNGGATSGCYSGLVAGPPRLLAGAGGLGCPRKGVLALLFPVGATLGGHESLAELGTLMVDAVTYNLGESSAAAVGATDGGVLLGSCGGSPVAVFVNAREAVTGDGPQVCTNGPQLSTRE